MHKLVNILIREYGGLEDFKQFIQEYNKYTKDNYLSNKEIILSMGNNKKVNQ